MGKRSPSIVCIVAISAVLLVLVLPATKCSDNHVKLTTIEKLTKAGISSADLYNALRAEQAEETIDSLLRSLIRPHPHRRASFQAMRGKRFLRKLV